MTNKSLVTIPSFKANYEQDQIISLEFTSTLIENEIQSIQLSIQNEIVVSSKNCSNEFNSTSSICVINLHNITSGTFLLEYISLNTKVIPLGNVILSDQIEIINIIPNIFQ